ncbi:MAG TPA: M48 family metalloprotease [Gaiellaceae bacterium]|jgi:STE24 endopeptidase|nr:M48 family metalloprotease [Gaiellaceae bacterium]
MSERTAARIGAATLALAGFGVAAWLLWRTQVPSGLDTPPVRFRAPRADEYSRLPRALWAGRTAAELALLAALVAAGPWLARRLRYGIAVLLAVLAALWLVDLPFGLVLHWWDRRYGLTRQSYLAWLVDPWLELLAMVAVASLALVLAMFLARRLGRRWWLAGGPALAVLGAAAILLQPFVLVPRLDPLRDGRLAAEIRQLGTRLGVRPREVDVEDVSDRTTRINAEVAGYGPTRRVVLWSTLLERDVPRGEVRFIAAHELAHVARRHVWKGVAWFALLATPIVFVVAEATRRRGGLGNPAAVPLAVLVLFVVELALLPFANAVSRRYEAEADWVALAATRDPASARGLFERFATANLASPSPPRWSYVLLGTHPSLDDRIAMAEAWARLSARRSASRAGS